jgi:glucokinase
MVSDALGVPVFVEHDARVAAVWVHARLPDPRSSLAYLSVGTGISAAVVIEGRLLRGGRGLAGEIGHVVADPEGPQCVCGLRGCLEAVAAGPAVARLAREAGLEATDPAAVYRLADGGDPAAAAIAEAVGTSLARSVRALVLAFGVDRVVIGGGMARAGQPFIGPILAHLEKEKAESALVREAFTDACVELLADLDAGARGAIAVARAGLQGEVDDG